MSAFRWTPAATASLLNPWSVWRCLATSLRCLPFFAVCFSFAFAFVSHEHDGAGRVSATASSYGICFPDLGAVVPQSHLRHFLDGFPIDFEGFFFPREPLLPACRGVVVVLLWLGETSRCRAQTQPPPSVFAASTARKRWATKSIVLARRPAGV